MGILRTNTLSGIGTDGPIFDGVTKFDTQGYVVPPVGITSNRTLVGVTTAQGAIRFNTDSQKLEFYAQDQWWEMVIDTPALAVGSNSEAGARGVFGGGMDTAPSSEVNIIDYINISSTGNATDFGDLTLARDFTSATSSATRGIWFGGVNPGVIGLNNIDYVTISSTGNAIDFGAAQSVAQRNHGAVSNGSRGIYAGTSGNIIEYVTIASTGNRQDFGDLYYISTGGGSVNSPTRGVFCGGSDGPAPVAEHNVIQYITMSTLGNSTDFGDLTSIRGFPAGVCNSTRGVIGGGRTPTALSTIDYITIASLGNAISFGTLTQARNASGGCSSPTRGVFGGGYAPGTVNTIDYIIITTQGNAVDFGDLTVARRGLAGLSNAHGGL